MYKVLLVDDEAMVTQGLTRFVNWQEAGYTVAGTATSVAKALDFLEKEPVDLVITDIQMPGQNGIDLIRILKDLYPQIKTIILSGYTEFSYAQQAIRFGALDYLTKPINFAAMRTLLEEVRVKLDEENQRTGEDSRLQELLTHTLILNIANGLSYDEARAAVCLNTHCPITAVRFSHRDKVNLPENISQELQERFSPCQVVSPSETELLLILEGERDLHEVFRELTLLTEQAAPCGVALCVGVSEQCSGYAELRGAVMQAGKAMRYQKARSGPGVMLYEQVHQIFLNHTENDDETIHHLVELLTTPEMRGQLISEFTGALSEMENHADYSIAGMQRFCTELLVEMDSPIQDMNLPDYPRHVLLSEALMDVLGAKKSQDIQTYMVDYLERVLDKLQLVDESQQAGELIDRVKEYISVHYAENLTLAVLSEIFYVCPAYLSRLFKKKTGINFVDHLTALRMEKAKELLANPALKIYNIAEMVGYENPRYFSRLFKEAAGCGPQEYRSMLNGEEAPAE